MCRNQVSKCLVQTSQTSAPRRKGHHFLLGALRAKFVLVEYVTSCVADPFFKDKKYVFCLSAFFLVQHMLPLDPCNFFGTQVVMKWHEVSQK